MATYSGLWDGVHGDTHSLLSNTKGNAYHALGRVFSGRNYGRAELRELVTTLVEGASGADASATHKRVQGRVNLDGNAQGGVIPIETFEAVDRATAASDVTAIAAALAITSKPTTYATDLSGNGGGGKLGR